MKIHTLWLALLIPAFSVSAKEAETLINIPHDPGVRHALVEKSPQGQQRVVVVTRRDGMLGALYSRHLYDCRRHTVALLGTAEDLQALNTERPAGAMLPVVERSTAYYIESEACS